MAPELLQLTGGLLWRNYLQLISAPWMGSYKRFRELDIIVDIPRSSPWRDSPRCAHVLLREAKANKPTRQAKVSWIGALVAALHATHCEDK